MYEVIDGFNCISVGWFVPGKQVLQLVLGHDTCNAMYTDTVYSENVVLSHPICILKKLLLYTPGLIEI